MYELIKAGEQSYYIDCPAKMGIYLPGDGTALLIDSGNDKEAGKKAYRILEEKGLRLTGILVTHSNADHIGGCRFLQGKTGCRVFSRGIEGAFTEYPVLEPSFLYGGYPCRELRHKFLMAQGSEVTDFSHEDFPKEVEIIPLPGHFFDMTGFLTPDGTAFIADCLASRETLKKYRISFIYDVGAYLETLEKIKSLQAKIFVPSHAPAAEDISELADINISAVHEIAERIISLCRQPACFENILKGLFDELGMAMNFSQYVLAGSTVRSYLSWLFDSGRVTAEFTGNMLLWRAV